MTQKKEKGKSSTQKSPVKDKNERGSDAAGLCLDAEDSMGSGKPVEPDTYKTYHNGHSPYQHA